MPKDKEFIPRKTENLYGSQKKHSSFYAGSKKPKNPNQGNKRVAPVKK